MSLASIQQQMQAMGLSQFSPDDQWVDASTVTSEEWLEWTGLTQYSGCFSNAVVEAGLLYLKSYTGYWFMVCGVRVTDEVILDHTPRLQQISQ